MPAGETQTSFFRQRPPREPSVDLKKQMVVDFIHRRGSEGIDGVKAAYMDSMTAIWRNPAGITPKQIFAELDTDGMDLLRTAQATLAFLEAVRPGSTSDLPKATAGWTLTPELGQDQQPTGRVVVTEPA